MEIFIGNLPAVISQAELLQFFKGYHKRNGIEVRIVDEDTESGIHHRYAVVTIEHERLAAKALKKLNGAQLKGNHVTLHEYQHRSYGNERRAVGWRNRPWDGPERRQADRRLKLKQEAPATDVLFEEPPEVEEEEKVDADHIKISAYTGMARKF